MHAVTVSMLQYTEIGCNSIYILCFHPNSENCYFHHIESHLSWPDNVFHSTSPGDPYDHGCKYFVLLWLEMGRQSLGEAIGPMCVLSFAVTAMLTTANTDIRKHADDDHCTEIEWDTDVKSM